jgi:hypothetical protein
MSTPAGRNPGEDDHPISELAADRTGALSPFGDLTFPLPSEDAAVHAPGHDHQPVAVAGADLPGSPGSRFRTWMNRCGAHGRRDRARTPPNAPPSRRAHCATRADVVELIATGGLPKGDALATARVAGILAAKRTSELIPLCTSWR